MKKSYNLVLEVLLEKRWELGHINDVGDSENVLMWDPYGRLAYRAC